MTAERTDPDTNLPILRVRAGDVPERMLVVGDPARATRVADRLASVTELAHNREYRMYRGEHQGRTVGVVSHGVGAPGAALCFTELCRAGASRIIRAGSTGGLQPDVVDGDLVVAHGAVRDDGLTERLVPTTYPAIASIEVVSALRGAAAERERPVVEGIVLSSDLFYPGEVLGDQLAQWARAGVVAVEMECSALFVVASLHGVHAGAILAVDGNPLAAASTDMAGYDPYREVVDRAVDSMIDIALDALVAP